MTVTDYSSMRRQISYCFAKLRARESVTLVGMEHSVGKVIKIVEILKERMGWLYQVATFTSQSHEAERGDRAPHQQRRVGLIVKLCLYKTTLAQENVGAQKPAAPHHLAPQRKNNGDSRHHQ